MKMNQSIIFQSNYNITDFTGCWIGLRYDSNQMNDRNIKDLSVTERQNSYEWVLGNEGAQGQGTPGNVPPYNVGTLKLSFRDWRRINEPNAYSISEGYNFNDVEKCVELVSWEYDPLHVEQGLWNDINCKLKKPFICQSSYITNRYQLTINNQANLYGGAFSGGIMVVHDMTTINTFNITNGGILQLIKNHSISSISPPPSKEVVSIIKNKLNLYMGSELHVGTNLQLVSGSFIGETIIPYNTSIDLENTGFGVQPLIRLLPGGNVSVITDVNNLFQYNHVVINASLDMMPSSMISIGDQLNLIIYQVCI